MFTMGLVWVYSLYGPQVKISWGAIGGYEGLLGPVGMGCGWWGVGLRLRVLGFDLTLYMVVSLNYCSPNGGNLYRAPYYNGNPKKGPRIIGNLDQYPYGDPN